MAPHAFSTRWLVALLSALMIIQAGAVAPASVSAEEPSAAPSPAVEETVPPPSLAPAASPTPDPVPATPLPSPPPDAPPFPESSPDTSAPAPSSEPIDLSPAAERLDLRTADSDTFEQADGSFVTRLYSGPVYYQPEDRTDWQPIDARLAAVDGDGASARSDKAAARLELSAADATGGFLSLAGGGHTIRLGLPAGVPAGRSGVRPQIHDDGLFADYADFLPGGIGLRVFPHADGFKSFLVLPARPASDTFTLALDAPGLTFGPQEDGSFEIRDQEGAVVGRIPRPFLMDSSELEGRGGGLYSEAVTMSVSQGRTETLLTLTVEPEFLDAAIYPIYVDPTVSDFPYGTGTTAQDTFASSKYPSSNFNTYQRPDSPYYREMWHGNEPGTSAPRSATTSTSTMRCSTSTRTGSTTTPSRA